MSVTHHVSKIDFTERDYCQKDLISVSITPDDLLDFMLNATSSKKFQVCGVIKRLKNEEPTNLAPS